MGSKPGKAKSVPRLRSSELQEFSKQTLFSNDKIEKLYTHFYTISTSQTDDGVIDFQEFCSVLSLTDNVMTTRLFHLFDANKDGVINFREFLLGISTFINSFSDDKDAEQVNGRYLISSAKLQEQIDMSFRLFDLRGNGKVYVADLKSVLAASLHSLKLPLTELQLQQVAENSFSGLPVQEDENGRFIDRDTYKRMLWRNQEALKWLSVDLERVALGARALMQASKSGKKAKCL